jgi:uncharacterized membrane protein
MMKSKEKSIISKISKKNSNAMKMTIPASNTTSNHFYDRKKLLLELVTIAFIIIMFGTAFYVYPLLPEKIPTHWDAAGNANGFSGRAGVFTVPIIYVVLSILLFFLPLMEVFRDNMLKIYKYYYAFKIIFGVFFTVLFIATILPNFGYDINLSDIVIWMVSLMFIGLGFILPKLKRNFMFGIRTGWTLSSDEVWEKTHRLGGILFVLLGFITIILLFLLNLQTLFFTFIILTLLIAIFLVFYSYYIYRKLKK